ncbi:hypothetical protein Tco_0792657 [Tanacetum coccineum]
MDQENYVEGCSMKISPLLEVNGFYLWKTRFETYIKSKDINLWQVNQSNDFYSEIEDSKTKMMKEMPAKVTAIKEAKDLATLPLDELIGNLKVYEMILKNDGVISKTTIKEKVKSLALKAKVTREQTSDDSDSQGGSDEDVDKEEAEAFNLIARNLHKFFRKGNRFGCGNRSGNVANREECHFISECPKPKENKVFVERAWSDSEDGDEPQNDATCLMEIDSQEVCLKCDLLSNDWIVNSGCTKHMTGNRRLFISYKAYDGGNVVLGSSLKGEVISGVLAGHKEDQDGSSIPYLERIRMQHLLNRSPLDPNIPLALQQSEAFVKQFRDLIQRYDESDSSDKLHLWPQNGAKSVVLSSGCMNDADMSAVAYIEETKSAIEIVLKNKVEFLEARVEKLQLDHDQMAKFFENLD